MLRGGVRALCQLCTQEKATQYYRLECFYLIRMMKVCE